LVQAPLYQNGASLATGDLLLEPLSYGVRQIHGLSAQVNAGQAVLAFEVLDHMSVVSGIADLRDAEEPDQFLLGHDGGTGTEFAI